MATSSGVDDHAFAQRTDRTLHDRVGVHDAGAAYVFTRSGTTWTQRAYLKASHPRTQDLLGDALAVSADGTTVAVGARDPSSAATGIDGDGTDSSGRSTLQAHPGHLADHVALGRVVVKRLGPARV